MDRFQRSWYRLVAKTKYLELKRQEFQAWIGKILEHAYLGDYFSIRLTQGDGGLDGIILSQNAVAAVYAPRNSTKGGLENKITSDFESAKETLKNRDVKLGKLILIHNDEGLTSEVGTHLLKLRQSESDVTFEVWTFERLWLAIESLTDNQLIDLFGEAPSIQVMEQLEMPSIRQVIEYLASVKSDALPLSEITIPSLRKLEHNNLNADNQHILRGGRSKHALVEQFFNGMTDPTVGEKIAESFRRKYLACRESGMQPDDIFETLWHLAGGNHFTTPPQRAAVIAILSHLFDSCDIFENAPPTL